ncbi:MAG: VCBS domain-containing protein, partial [Actinomycetota bacterium]|nr:VCBS domain-containing protein [Actinomycetota bacterium]
GSDDASTPGKSRSSSYGGSSSGAASGDTGSPTSSGDDSDAGAEAGDDDDDSGSLTSPESELDVDAELDEDDEDDEDDDVDADSGLSSGGDPQDTVSDEEPQLETDEADELPTQSPETEAEEDPDVAPPVESTQSVPDADPAAATETASAAPEPDPESPSQTETPTSVTLSAAAVPEPEAVTAAPAAVTAAATAAPGTGEWYFLGTLERAVRRLAGWPGTPRDFVDITNYQTDQSLDAANDQLDNLVFTVPTGSPARWLPDLLNMAGAFFVAAIPGSLFTDSLNAMGDFLNRVVPPFKIAPGADTLNVITPYKIMGAAVVGTATVLEDMLNGEYDPAQWAIHVIKATTGANVTTSDLTDFGSLSGKVVAAQAAALLGGDGGAFDEPERAWDITLPTWTAAQVNPFTVVTYVVLVGMYKRFQEMAVLTTFTTSTTYESWHYKNALGMYAAGSFHAVDPDGNPVDFFGVSQGGTYSSDTNALVTINTANGGYTYTPPAVWDPNFHDAEFFHRSTSENPADRYDYVNIPVRSADGVRYTLRFGVEIIGGTNANPTGSFSVINTDAAGVVKGRVNGADSDGDTLTYSLVASSVNDLDGNSAYTKNGSNNGGIVTLNETTGDFTYVSSATAGATQSFQVMINDGHYGNTPITVTVPNTTTINPASVDTSTENVVTGTVPGSTNYPGLFTGYALGTAPTKGTVTSFNPATGEFTYTRNAGLGHTTTSDDVVTVLATDANGRTVTLRMAVQPTVDNNAPTLTLTTAPTVGTLSGTTQTSTGKVTYSDPDGDAPIWPSSVTTARGGTVTFASDGSFTYTSNLSTAQRHEAARIGAAGSTYNGVALAAYEDAFTVTVADGFGGTAQVTVTVPIYAINSTPTISGFGSQACAFWTCTVGTMTVSDPDGDNIPRTAITPGTGAGYTLDAGSVTVWGSGTTTISWPASGTFGTGRSANTFTVYDGYYTVTNGVVNVGTPAKFWANWAAGSGNRTTGN